MALVCCDLIGKGCSSLGECLGLGLSLITRPLEYLCCKTDRRFPLVMSYSFMMNLPMAVICGIVMAAEPPGSDCGKAWLFMGVQTLLFVLHIIFSFYFEYKFEKMREGEEHPSTTEGDVKASFSSIDRCCRMFLFDCGMFMFFFVIAFGIVWNILGLVWHSGVSSCMSSGFSNVYVASIIVYFCYLLFGGCVLSCAGCCNAGRDIGGVFSRKRRDYDVLPTTTIITTTTTSGGGAYQQQEQRHHHHRHHDQQQQQQHYPEQQQQQQQQQQYSNGYSKMPQSPSYDN
eukprot:TRINITY_DN1482_c7_g1_i1.p1 TRINITY_DN1482_c7_g1~~TRINITY_DN1482_c7_g1_i1.p1  ORF type:complete len:286 (-),score=74.78 TRINITY_DN1482_c7_g1_i1:14-871(-)